VDGFAGRLPAFQVVYIVREAPAGWAGETGRIDGALLSRHLPKHYQRMQYFRSSFVDVCK
jgi:NAD(P)H-flavin reductase